MKQIQLTKCTFAIVDDTDYDYLNQWKWHNSNGYAKRKTRIDGNKWKTVNMHRIIWEKHNGKIPDCMSIDHIDRNPLNNQLSNLRLADKQKNMANIEKFTKRQYTSKYKGVARVKSYNGFRYVVDIKNRRTGARVTKYFPYTNDGEIQAAKWYDKKAIEIFGEFACTNFN